MNRIVFDTLQFGELLTKGVDLPVSSHTRYLATAAQLSTLNLTKDQVIAKKMQFSFTMGRPSLITDPISEDRSDTAWHQRGAEYGDLKLWFERNYPENRHPRWEDNLDVVEVALNEDAVVVSDEPQVQAMMQAFDGHYVSSAEILQR